MLEHYYSDPEIVIRTGAFAFISEEDVCENGHLYHDEYWEDGDTGTVERRRTLIGQCPSVAL